MLQPARADDPTGHFMGERSMSWRKPKVTRIAVGCEINAYGCAVV
jgi:coenzyme PQQ precursor peptide PqqA